MPLDPGGIYRERLSKKSLAPRGDFATRRAKGKIASWNVTVRSNFERELLARQKSIRQIAEEYGISEQTAHNWKQKVLTPAIRAAQQQDDIVQAGEARTYLGWLLGKNRDSINDLTEGQQVTDPETGETKTVKGDPRVHGTVAQQLGQGANLVKLVGELTGEFAEAEAIHGQPKEQTVIRVISLPKCGETFGVEVSTTKPAPPIKLQPVSEEATETYDQ